MRTWSPPLPIYQRLECGPIGLEGLDDYLIQNIKSRGMYPDEVAQLPEGGGFLIVEFGAAILKTAALTPEVSARPQAP
jgi:hypothetical protein